MTAYWQATSLTKGRRQVLRPLRLAQGGPVRQRRAASARRSSRHSRKTLRCTPRPPSRPIVTTTTPPTTTITLSSIDPRPLRPPLHHLPQRGSVYLGRPMPEVTPHLPIRPLLHPPPLPHLPHTTIIPIITTITTIPIITTTTPHLLPPPLVLPVLLPLTHPHTMPTPTAPAPLTPPWAPQTPPPILPAPHTPHPWASRSLTRVLLQLKCNTGWSETPQHQLEPMQRG